MSKIINGNRKIKCPHCKEPLVGSVGDYIVAGKVGAASVHREYSDCGNCDGIFSVEALTKTKFEVTPVVGKYGDHRP